MSIWIILGVLAVVLLALNFQKKNAVWGGLTLGIVVGIIVALFYLFEGNGFNWLIVAKFGIGGTILGYGAELLGKISKK